MFSVPLNSLAGVPVVAFMAWLGRRLPGPAPLAWAGTGLLCGPALLNLAEPGGGRVLVEGAALLVFFEMGLRLTDQQGRLVCGTAAATAGAGGRMVHASVPCATAVFAAAVAGAHALGATLPQSFLAGLVLLPVGVLLPPDAVPRRSVVLLGTGTASLCGLVAFPLLASEAPVPGWILALRQVFICVAFVSIALVLRHHLVPRRLHAATRREKKGALPGVAASMLALVGTSAWIGPGLGFSCFLAGLVLSRGRWKGHALFTQFAAIRTGGTLLFFAGLGVLAASLANLDLALVAISVAGGILFLRAGTLAFFKRFRQRVAAARQALCLGPLRAPLGAVAFPVLYAGLDAQALPVAWTAAAPPVLAIVALMLAGGRALEERLWTAARRSPSGTSSERLAPDAEREAARRALCNAPFFARPRPAEHAPDLHLVRVAPDAPATCLSLRRLALRRYYGVEIVGLWRHDAYVHAPPEDYTLRAGDHVLLSAAPAQLSRSARVFRTSLH